MHSGTMSPAQQYQTSPHSLFFPAPSHAPAYSAAYSSAATKTTFPGSHFLNDLSPVPPLR